MIICGDALTELRKLPDESVNCCVTSPPLRWVVDCLYCPIQALTQGKHRRAHGPLAVTVPARPIFAFSEFQDGIGLSLFYHKKRTELADYIRRRKVVGLVAIKWSFAICAVLCFAVVVSAESLFEKADTTLLDHSYLHPLMILGALGIGPDARLLDSNITLSVNYSCQISNQFVFSHKSLIPRKRGDVKWVRLSRGTPSRYCELSKASPSTVRSQVPLIDWGLRDYGTAKWEGGDQECDHIKAWNLKRDNSGGLKPTSLLAQGPTGTRGQQSSTSSSTIHYGQICERCGAIRIDAQLGLEKTPEEYVAHLVEVFREVRRVLRKDGTLWLNLGDSYAGSGKGGNPEGSEWSGFVGNKDREKSAQASKPIIPDGLKPKDLVGIPWRVAFALQADGWWLRQDIIWAKPNPMPESVRDRCTKAHEYIFMLSKAARYWYDADAVKEPSSEETIAKCQSYMAIPMNEKRYKQNDAVKHLGVSKTASPNMAWSDPEKLGRIIQGRNLRSVWPIATHPFPEAHFATFPPEIPERCIKAGCPEKQIVCNQCGIVLGYKHGTDGIYKLQDVWEVLSGEGRSPQAQAILRQAMRFFMDRKASGNNEGLDAFEQGLQDDSLPEPSEQKSGWICNGASSCDGEEAGQIFDQERDCPSYQRAEGGQPRRKPIVDDRGRAQSHDSKRQAGNPHHLPALWEENQSLFPCPKCSGDIRIVRGTILDPFFGAGTTGLVAMRLGREFIGIELNKSYCLMAKKRIYGTLGMTEAQQ